MNFSLSARRFIKRNNFIIFFLSIIIFMMLQGCGTLPNGRKWGQDATLTPGWEKIKSSTINAVKDPETWAPVAGALALQINHMDQRISDKASKNTPVFGSGKKANEWSTTMERGSAVIYLASVLATPSGDETSEWYSNKGKGLAIGLAASGITSGLTASLKTTVGRTRPTGSDNNSFPSGHESCTAVFTTLTRRNLDYISISQGRRLFADIGIAGLIAGTAWGRVEAKAHYPSDVLVGYALGHFVSSVVNDSFLGLNNKNAPLITMEPSRKGMFVGLNWKF
jgi:hypothetical protein